MDRRVRWFNIGSDSFSLRKLEQRMRDDEFSKRRSWGFRLDAVRRDWLSGRYIEKSEYDQTIADPLGGEVIVHRVDYSQTSFRLSTEAPQLEIYDPPRSYRHLLSQLGQYMNFEASITPIEIDVGAWLKLVEKRLDAVRVIAMQVGRVPVGSGILAGVLVEGADDVRRSVTAFLASRDGLLERVSLAWERDVTSAQCELTRGGARFQLADERTVWPVLRETLRAIASRD